MAVDLERAKAHLGIDWEMSAEQSALLTGYLAGAKLAVEKWAQTLLEERAIVQRLDTFIDRHGRSSVRLSWAPVVSIEGIDYLDAGGVEATLTELAGDFRTVLGEPTFLLPPVDGSWPDVFGERGSIRIRYTAGYGGEGEEAVPTPGDLEVAVLMLVAHYWHNREAVVTGTIAEELPLGVVALCDPYRHTLL